VQENEYKLRRKKNKRKEKAETLEELGVIEVAYNVRGCPSPTVESWSIFLHQLASLTETVKLDVELLLS
jgi:coenzyme F420-reducing hydrogenase gamma subunit